MYALGLVAVWTWGALQAQEVPAAQEEPTPTLHVYTNLIQVPTLVLTTNQDLIDKPIAENRFSVSIDAGRWFRATHVRREGDDPISLSVFLDVRGETARLLRRMEDAMGNLAPLSLHAKDRVSIYAQDCSLVRSLNDAPADSELLKKGLAGVLDSSLLHKKSHGETRCELRGHLWDGVGQVAVALSSLPGRRVILVVTDGHDAGSKRSWDEVREFAQAKGIAIFALSYSPIPSVGMGSGRPGRGAYVPSGGGASVVDKPLRSICELSGGVVMRMSDSAALSKALQQFVTMLRERYIVEFPRPTNSTAGEHGLEVKIDKGVYIIIRPSGVSVPLPDPALKADPTTIQAGPSQAPEQGTQRPNNRPR
jgi:hypothetical protein